MTAATFAINNKVCLMDDWDLMESFLAICSNATGEVAFVSYCSHTSDIACFNSSSDNSVTEFFSTFRSSGVIFSLMNLFNRLFICFSM